MGSSLEDLIYDGKIIFTPLMPNDNIFILLYDELG